MPNALRIESLPPIVSQVSEYMQARALMAADYEIRLSGLRRDLYDYLRGRLPEGRSVKRAAEEMGETIERTRNAMYDLIKQGYVRTEGKGNTLRTFYAIPPRLASPDYLSDEEDDDDVL